MFLAVLAVDAYQYYDAGSVWKALLEKMQFRERLLTVGALNDISCRLL